MSKEHKRSNRELKKPKKPETARPAAAPQTVATFSKNVGKSAPKN